MTGRKASGTQWEALDESQIVQIYQNVDDPEDISVIQFTAAPKGWVELPDCTGATGEVVLAFDKANASSATCKQRGAEKSWASS